MHGNVLKKANIVILKNIMSIEIRTRPNLKDFLSPPIG